MIFEIIFLIIAKQQLKQGDLIADRQLNLTTDKEYTKELLEELQRELAAAVRGDNGERIVIAI